MIFDKIEFSSIQPSRTDIAWAKPVKGGFALYLYFNGRWNPQVIMDSNNSIYPEDDTEVDLTDIPTVEVIDEKIEVEVTKQIGDQIETEVARQMSIHDAAVGDTHNTPSDDSQDYPEVDILG